MFFHKTDLSFLLQTLFAPSHNEWNYLFVAFPQTSFDQDSCHYILANKLVDENQIRISSKIRLVLGFANEQIFRRFNNYIDFGIAKIIVKFLFKILSIYLIITIFKIPEFTFFASIELLDFLAQAGKFFTI